MATAFLSRQTDVSSGGFAELVDRHDAAIWEVTKAMLLAMTLAAIKTQREADDG